MTKAKIIRKTKTTKKPKVGKTIKKDTSISKTKVNQMVKNDTLTFDGKIIDLKEMNHEADNYIEKRFDILGAVRTYKPCNMKRADSPMGFFANNLSSGKLVILKPCGSGYLNTHDYQPHQVIIDEWKTLVGLEKMGTNYFICETNYIHNEWKTEKKKNLYWSLKGLLKSQLLPQKSQFVENIHNFIKK